MRTIDLDELNSLVPKGDITKGIFSKPIAINCPIREDGKNVGNYRITPKSIKVRVDSKKLFSIFAFPNVLALIPDCIENIFSGNVTYYAPSTNRIKVFGEKREFEEWNTHQRKFYPHIPYKGSWNNWKDFSISVGSSWHAWGKATRNENFGESDNILIRNTPCSDGGRTYQFSRETIIKNGGTLQWFESHVEILDHMEYIENDVICDSCIFPESILVSPKTDVGNRLDARLMI